MKRNNLLKKLTALIITTCLLTLTACSNTTSNDTSNIHEPLTIMTNENNDYKEFISALHEVYPEINIELISYKGANSSEYFNVLLEAGDIPDIFITTYPSNGDLQEKYLIDLSNETFTSKFNSSLLSNVAVNGEVYLLPANVSYLGIYYNKTLFEENNWQVPNSLEELEELIPTITEAGYTLSECATKFSGVVFSWYFAIGAGDYFNTLDGSAWIKNFLKGEASAKGNIEEATELFQRWVDDGIINIGLTPDKDQDTRNRFINEGRSAFLFTNSDIGFSQNEDGTGDQYGLLPYLSIDGSNNTVITNVSTYIGLSKTLEDKPNKLQDAKKVMEFIATEKGQESLNTKSNVVSTLNENDLSEDSPLYDINKMVKEGKSMEIVYSGWEDYVVDMGDYIKNMISGTLNSEEFINKVDALHKEIIEEGRLPAIADVKEDLDKTQVAKLVGIAFGKATNADCALISIGDYHGLGHLENKDGVNANIYAAVPLTSNVISTFNPLGWTGSIKTMTLTGKEIKDFVNEGYIYTNNDTLETDDIPFEYILVTKQGQELDDDTTYSVACVNESKERSLQGNLIDTEILAQDALLSYIKELGLINSKTIIWE